MAGRATGFIFCMLFACMCACGQERSWTDSARELKYQLDSVVEQTVVDEDSAGTTYDEDSDGEDEQATNQNYFLRKDLAGALPDSLQVRRWTAEKWKALRDDKAFWYANESFRKKQKSNERRLGNHPAFRTLLWVLIVGGFITFLFIYLANSNVSLFRKSRKLQDEEFGIDSGDIFAINYQQEIDKAVSAGDYRLAIRLQFLRLLRNLADKNHIQYRHDSTNFDYLVQLHHTPMYADFFRLTRNYEYSWYGQFDIDQQKYRFIKNEFENFERRLNQ